MTYIKINTYNKITSFGENKIYYYLTVSEYQTETDMDNFENATNEFSFQYNLDKVDATKDVILQIYELLLQEPQFSGGTLMQ